MARTRTVAAALLAAAIGLAASTYVGRETPTAPVLRVPTLTQGSLPGGGAAAAGIAQAPGRPQLAELERLIRAFTDQTTESPNASGFAFLGQLELERARLTGDVASYVRAEQALDDAVRLAPEDSQTQALLASVMYTTHDFTGAFELASEIYERDGELAALVVRGDSALELGNYPEATADYSLLRSVAPDASSTLVRLAKLAFITGDASEAARLASAAERAASSEGAYGATRSWYAAYQGKLALDGGRIDEAVAHYSRAMRAAPGYHVAIAGMASARAVQGRITAAIGLYERAVAAVPDPATLAALGDLYALTGDDRAAADRYATVEAIASLAGPAASLYDRQLAMFRADHGGDLGEALAIARTSLETRTDVYGHDVVAWVLYALGRYDEARAASDAALALGTPDPRLWYHAGMISAALEDVPRARAELGHALALNPAFDPLQADVAREALAALGGSA